MENFAKLLEESFKQKKNIVPGASFTATIIQETGDYYFIETENKIRGVLAVEEFLPEEKPKVKDTIQVFFLKEESGDFYFTHTLSHENINMTNLVIAKENQIPVLGQFSQRSEDGYQIKLGNLISFCPISQIDNTLLGSNLVGKKGRFIILSIEPKKIIVSQKKLKDLEYNKKVEKLKEEWKEGTVLPCKILEIMSHGLVVDVLGVKGLIPLSEASYKPNPELNKEYKIGQTVTAKILELNWDKKKLILSCKEFLEDPWVSQFTWKPGDITEGEVVKLKQFGIFVQLDSNFMGLVPWKEVGEQNRANHGLSYWEKIYKPGDKVRVSILRIEPEKRQITLSIQKAKEWDERLEYEKYLSKEEDINHSGSLGEFFKKSLKKPSN